MSLFPLPEALNATDSHTTAGVVLTLQCPDQPGVIHAVSGVLLELGYNIVESQEFHAHRDETFFMRLRAEQQDVNVCDVDALEAGLSSVADRFDITWRLTPASHKPRTLIMVSRYAHCLNDLLFRASSGSLPVDITMVVSNHPDLGHFVDNYGVPFRCVPVSGDNKPEAEAELLRLVEETSSDLVVLARYMQILSDDLCQALSGRAINIHHSMLPSFKGARPYYQAYDRGVKLVGATAHYVTADLDEGPIIEQDVARVDHGMTETDFTTLGRDTEARVLSRAVQWHCENRVMLHNGRTVIFK